MYEGEIEYIGKVDGASCWTCEKTWVQLGCVNFTDRCTHIYNCVHIAVEGK